MRSHWSLVMLAAVALVASALVGANAQEKVTVGSSVAFTQMPNRVGIDKGYFKAEGLDADLKIVPSGNDVIQALAGGSIDIGDSSHGLFLAAAAKGLPIVAIGLHSWGNVGRDKRPKTACKRLYISAETAPRRFQPAKARRFEAFVTASETLEKNREFFDSGAVFGCEALVCPTILGA